MDHTGAQILIQSLIDQGVNVLFGYPGGAVLNIYDALYERAGDIRHILASHEQGACHAADGYARSTGKTGVVLATSGPGATNLVTGIATAWHDSVPLVALTGNVARDLIGRDSFQEVNIVDISRSVVKKNYFVRDAADIASIVREAFEIAVSGRKGPVLIDFPKDVTAQKVPFVPQPKAVRLPDRAPDADALEKAAEAIRRCERPLIYAGGGATFSDAAGALHAFAKKIHAPVCTSLMGLTSLPADADLNLGLVGMHGTATANMAVANCDLLLAVGARFSDRVASNRAHFAKNATVIHLDIDPKEIGKNVRADIPLNGDVGAALKALDEMLPELRHRDWMHRLLQHKALNALPSARSDGDELNPREVITELHALVGRDAIIATDVGQHQMLVAQYYPFSRPRSFLSSCGLGTMGYGMGAANGAAVGSPGRPVVLFTGDGSFHMNMAELAVAVSNNLKIVVVVMNNRVLGMVHQWQKLFYKGRYSFTEIDRRTDFAKLAEAFGATGMRIERSAEIRPVLEKALACDGPCVVDCAIPSGQRVFPIIPPGGKEDDMIYSEEI